MRRLAQSFLLLAVLGLGTAQAQEPPIPSRLPRVMILATGGTIAGTSASATELSDYKAGKVGIQALMDAVPALKGLAILQGEQLFQIPSGDITSIHWLQLARRINGLLAQTDVDGIVVTHGTDTLEETAYFLNLVVKSRKAVVMTGSMRPATALSADGPLNLFEAVALAASPEARGKGVLVALHGKIHGAREVTKTNTSSPDTFRNWELGAMGYMEGTTPRFYRVSTRRHTAETEFDVSKLEALPQVDIVLGYANPNRIAVDAFVNAGAQAIIWAASGSGGVPVVLSPALIEARRKGVIVVRSTRIGHGIVARSLEERDEELGYVVSESLSAQKARILVMLALTRTKDPHEIQRMFSTY